MPSAWNCLRGSSGREKEEEERLFGLLKLNSIVPNLSFFKKVGCVVIGVLPGGPAEEAGLAEGDEVEAVTGIPLAGKSDFQVKQIMDSIRDEAEFLCSR